MIISAVVWIVTAALAVGLYAGDKRSFQRGFEAGLAEGVARGEKSGFAAGEKSGLAKGRREGSRSISANGVAHKAGCIYFREGQFGKSCSFCENF